MRACNSGWCCASHSSFGAVNPRQGSNPGNFNNIWNRQIQGRTFRLCPRVIPKHNRGEDHPRLVQAAPLHASDPTSQSRQCRPIALQQLFAPQPLQRQAPATNHRDFARTIRDAATMSSAPPNHAQLRAPHCPPTNALTAEVPTSRPSHKASTMPTTSFRQKYPRWRL